MSSPARVTADPAVASTIAAGEDCAVVQDPMLVQRGDSRVMDLERVGVFPGPRSCSGTKNLSVLIGVWQPLVDAQDYEPKPMYLDLWSATRDAGRSGAEIVTRANIALLYATLECLFKRVNHGDLRVLPDAVFLRSVYSSSPPADQPVVPSAPAPSGPAGAPGSHPWDEEGAKKRARTDGAEGDRPLVKMSVQAQWSTRFSRIMEYVPDLGRAMHIGHGVCSTLIARMRAELRELHKLARQDVTHFTKESEFTAMLSAMIDHSVLVQDPVVGCMALYQELAASSENGSAVAIRPGANISKTPVCKQA